MAQNDLSNPAAGYVELGDLLANTLGAVVQAQERLDHYSLARKQAYEQAEDGELALPPLWYLFNNVAVELELSAQVMHARAALAETPSPHLFCRTLNPTTVSLYGYQASAGMKVRVQMAPGGPLPVKQEIRSPTEQDGENDHG